MPFVLAVELFFRHFDPLWHRGSVAMRVLTIYVDLLHMLANYPVVQCLSLVNMIFSSQLSKFRKNRYKKGKQRNKLPHHIVYFGLLNGFRMVAKFDTLNPQNTAR